MKIELDVDSARLIVQLTAALNRLAAALEGASRDLRDAAAGSPAGRT